MFKDAVFLTVDEEVIDNSVSTSSVPVKVKGTLYGFLFDEKKLSAQIAAVATSDYDGSPISIPNMKDFIFSLTEKVESVKDIKNLNFSLTGNSKIIWEVDKDKIVNDLLGKSKKEFKEILSKYSNIEGAELVLRPLWRRTIPEEVKSIEVVLNQ